MIHKELPPEDLKPTELKTMLPAHVVRDIQTMATNTRQKVDDIVETSLKMYIATHNDYLRRNKVP